MAVQYDLTVQQGSSFSVLMTGLDPNSNPLNLNNYSLSAGLMSRYGSSGYLTNTGLVVSVVSGVDGTFTLNMNPQTTASLYVGRAVYDVKAAATGVGSTYKLYGGYVSILPEVI